MLKEGKGKVAPSPVQMALPLEVLRHYERIASDRERAHRYAHSSRQWARGLIARPTLTGLIAEWGCITYLNREVALRLQVDESFRPNGDGGIDLTLFGVSLQFKGRGRAQGFLIRRETEDGRILELPAQIYVASTWLDTGEGQEPNLSLTLDGWLTRKVLVGTGKFSPARRGAHMNLEIPESSLYPMSRLVSFLKNRRDVVW